ncbi:MAG: tetratricopeptide repeat protein [Deltaproteobacteria bacterium]|nr:tetratricopeptide repeat protein [Deltaproteobacteria bacterium]
MMTMFPFLTAFDPVRSRSAQVEEGNAKMKAGKADEALVAYDKAVAELPAEPGVHFDRGTALAALSRFDEAAEEFLRATEAKDTALKAAAFYNLANAFFKKDKFKEAVEAYKRTLALDPKDERAKWNLEIALKKQREDDKKKEQDKDKKDKDKKNDKDDKDKQDKKDDQDKKDQKDKDQDKDKEKDKDQKDEQKPKDEKSQEQDQAEQKPAAEKEMESVLDSLEKSPKDLEKQRARLRAVRRAPPTRDW